jgi:hypothetical protein
LSVDVVQLLCVQPGREMAIGLVFL